MNVRAILASVLQYRSATPNWLGLYGAEKDCEIPCFMQRSLKLFDSYSNALSLRFSLGLSSLQKTKNSSNFSES